jgi:hypothetical protein
MTDSFNKEMKTVNVVLYTQFANIFHFIQRGLELLHPTAPSQKAGSFGSAGKPASMEISACLNLFLSFLS